MIKTNFPSEESYDYLFHVLLKELISRIDNLALKTVRKDLLDSADLKQMYNLSDSSIYRLRRNGKIKFIKLGGKYYYSRQSIENLLK